MFGPKSRLRNIQYIVPTQKKSVSWLWTTVSKILFIKGNLEIGLIFFISVESTFILFKTGSITACLNSNGTMPWNKLLFIINNILGPIVSTTSLNNRDGRMSWREVVGFKCNIIFSNWAKVIKSKAVRQVYFVSYNILYKHNIRPNTINLVDKMF